MPSPRPSSPRALVVRATVHILLVGRPFFWPRANRLQTFPPSAVSSCSRRHDQTIWRQARQAWSFACLPLSMGASACRRASARPPQPMGGRAPRHQIRNICLTAVKEGGPAWACARPQPHSRHAERSQGGPRSGAWLAAVPAADATGPC